ncbi:MAG TPA: Sec-independent protein translocase subunit TatA [Mycobacteriales bacterium]|nr:Sec-independent protein translocase subunit TatA [Mycobacteriales bacterium]
MIFNELRPWHLLILVVVFLALFGYKKLPDATRSVGRSLRIFKSEMKGMHDDEPEKETAKPRAQTRPVIEGQSATAPAAEESTEAPQASAQQASSQEATSSTATPPTSGS